MSLRQISDHHISYRDPLIDDGTPGIPVNNITPGIPGNIGGKINIEYCPKSNSVKIYLPNSAFLVVYRGKPN
jgi:hypothetical protein